MFAGGIGGAGGSGGAPGHINVYAPVSTLQVIGLQPFTVFDDGGAGGAPGNPGNAVSLRVYMWLDHNVEVLAVLLHLTVCDSSW